MHLFSMPASPRLRVAGSCFHQNCKGEFKLPPICVAYQPNHHAEPPPAPSPHTPKQTKSDGSSPFFCETASALNKGPPSSPHNHLLSEHSAFYNQQMLWKLQPSPSRLLHLWHNSAVVVIELKSCYRTCWEMGGLCNL